MKRLFMIAAASMLALSGCAGLPSLGGAPPLAKTIIDEKAVNLAFAALETTSIVSKSLVETGVIKAGSPKALAIADGLENTLAFLQAASSAQRAGNSGDYFAAINKASLAYEAVRLAISKKD